MVDNTMTYQIIGACMQVHNELGYGFLENVYQEALELEFKEQNIPYKREERLEIYYKEHMLKQYYVADFVCDDEIIIEIKAVNELMPVHTSQLLNYLNATDISVGLLVNFGQKSLKYKRLVV